MTAPLPNPLHATARARPDHTVLAVGDARISAAGLVHLVATRAAQLAARGIGDGQTVALIAAPTLAGVVDLHAIWWLGAVPVPLPVSAPATELAALLAAHATDHSLLAAGDNDPVPDKPALPAAWHLEAPRLQLATSGTTGAPTIVRLSTLQLLLSTFGSAARIGHLPSDRWLCCLPLNHVGGLSILLRCAWLGTTVELHDGFDPVAVNDAIERGVTQLSLVPQLLERLLDARDDTRFPPHMRVILVGGAPMSDALAERCRAIYAPVSRTWGMTEAASQVATTEPGDLGPAMPPLPFADVQIDPAGDVLTVLGPLVAGGMLRTHDVGTVNDEGVTVTGRRDDLIISGGENIDPAEVEAVLLAHPSLNEVAVVGIPSAQWGERPRAFYVGEEVDPEELRMWCRGSLAGFKVPDHFEQRAALPKTALGKVQRRRLRDEVS